jgi:hypothetical protein
MTSVDMHPGPAPAGSARMPTLPCEARTLEPSDDDGRATARPPPGPLAQSAEQRTFNPRVVGSIPTGPTDTQVRGLHLDPHHAHGTPLGHFSSRTREHHHSGLLGRSELRDRRPEESGTYLQGLGAAIRRGPQDDHPIP